MKYCPNKSSEYVLLKECCHKICVYFWNYKLTWWFVWCKLVSAEVGKLNQALRESGWEETYIYIYVELINVSTHLHTIRKKLLMIAIVILVTPVSHVTQNCNIYRVKFSVYLYTCTDRRMDMIVNILLILGNYHCKIA